MKYLVESNRDDFGTLTNVRVNFSNLVEERFGVVFVEAEEAEILAGGRTGDQKELLGGVAEGVNGNALEALLN